MPKKSNTIYFVDKETRDAADDLQINIALKKVNARIRQTRNDDAHLRKAFNEVGKRANRSKKNP